MHQKLKGLAEKHERLGDHIQKAILALWKFTQDNPELRAFTDDVHSNLDRALEMHQKCSSDLEQTLRGVERPE